MSESDEAFRMASLAVEAAVIALGELKYIGDRARTIPADDTDSHSELSGKAERAFATLAEKLNLATGVNPYFERLNQLATSTEPIKAGGEAGSCAHEVAGIIALKTYVLVAMGMSNVRNARDLHRKLDGLFAGTLDPDIAKQIPKQWLSVRSQLAGINDENFESLASRIRLERASILREVEGATGHADQADPLSRALGLLAANPNWTDKQIAQAVGVHPKTLNKPTWARYRAARDAMKIDPPAGSKGKDGTVEAWDDE